MAIAKADGHAGTTDFILIRIMDTGTGIDADTQTRLFEPFFSTKSQTKGAGLGLSMVHGFAHRSGGFVKVLSSPGEGAIFELYLPRAAPTPERSAEPATSAGGIPRGSETVLIVDDEELLLEIAATHLQALGYSTVTAANGDEALRILNDTRDIDLMFTDIVMPGTLNGFQLARAARELLPDLSILFASGFALDRATPEEDATSRIAQLPFDILEKPYGYAELADAVRTTLNGMEDQ